MVSHLAHRYYHPRVEDAGDCFTIVNTTDASQTRDEPDSHAEIARDRPSRYGGYRRTVRGPGPRATVTVEGRWMRACKARLRQALVLR